MQAFAHHELEIIHDFDLTHSRRPRVLVQTAGHVSGAAYYYQRHDVTNDPWPPEKVYNYARRLSDCLTQQYLIIAVNLT